MGQKLLATFQRLLEIPVIGPVDQRARVEGVQRLQSEFGAVIRAVVATIVREIPLGPLDKSVKLIPTPPEQPDPITLFAHKGK